MEVQFSWRPTLGIRGLKRAKLAASGATSEAALIRNKDKKSIATAVESQYTNFDMFCAGIFVESEAVLDNSILLAQSMAFPLSARPASKKPGLVTYFNGQSYIKDYRTFMNALAMSFLEALNDLRKYTGSDLSTPTNRGARHPISRTTCASARFDIFCLLLRLPCEQVRSPGLEKLPKSSYPLRVRYDGRQSGRSCYEERSHAQFGVRVRERHTKNCTCMSHFHCRAKNTR